MNLADAKDGGARSVTAYADHISVTAGGAGDNAEASGPYVDRQGSDYGPAQSAKLVITYAATLAAGATMTIAANIQDATASDGTGVDDFGTAYAAATIATGETGGSTETGTVEFDFDLSGANRYLRSQITPNLSAANTDTAHISATWVFFGAEKAPISASVI